MSSLRELIRTSFDESELKDLCHDLAVDYEDLPAVGKAAKVRELILYCERHGRLPELIAACRQSRPHIVWPDASWPLIVAELLGEPGKPPLPYEPESVEVPAGVFLMGSPAGEDIPGYECPQHEVALPAYRIGKYPLTNAQYAEFVKQTKHLAPQKVGWFGKTPPKNKLDHPVVGVSWYDAVAYCQWLSEQTGRPYRLPTEAEWEKAARGTDGRLYPWGNEWDSSRCNCSGKDTTAVTAYPAGQSPYGCFDMVGNVWEWTSTLWGSNWQEAEFVYPYSLSDGREKLDVETAVHRLFRGGSYSDEISQLRCSARAWYAPDHKDRRRGFRVVMAS